MNLLMTLLDAQSTNAFGVSDEFLSGVVILLVYIFAAVAATSVIFALYLAFNLAKAQDEQARSKAKKRIINAVASLLTVVILTVALFGTGAVTPDDILNNNNNNNNRPPGTGLVDGDRVAQGSHWRMLGIIVREIDIYIQAPTIRDPVRNINITMDGWDVAEARRQLNALPGQLTDMSNGQMTGIMHIHVVEQWAPNAIGNYFIWCDYHLDYSPHPHLLGSLARPFLGQSLNQFDHVSIFMRLRCSDQAININTGWIGQSHNPVSLFESNGVRDLPLTGSILEFPQQRNTWHAKDEGWREHTIVHEFLHGLEYLAYSARHISIDCVLHSATLFGYTADNLPSAAAREFYQRFLRRELYLNGQPFGLTPASFRLRHTERFRPWL